MFFKIKLSHLKSDKLPTIACADLGAFNQIGKNNLAGKGIDAIVIMEDRLPDFFVTYKDFEPHKDTTLNRHGPFKILSNQKHLQNLVKELQSQNIKVYLGFWGQLLVNHQKNETVKWLADHQELWSLHQANSQNYDLNPLVTLQPENISFAQFIVEQYQKLYRDFNFDGLFLGDGLNGYRFFMDPTQLEDKAQTATAWNNFYQIIALGVYQQKGKLLAYDCLGLTPNKALLHGADYLGQAQAGLDYLIVQTYPTAWGKKWLKNFRGFDFKSAQTNLNLIHELLNQTNCQVFYTLELGDRIEDWQNGYFSIKKQLQKFKNIADGKLLVWANELFFKNSQ